MIAAKNMKPQVDLDPYITPMIQQWEIWLRELAGYSNL
jgi:hypothetical protein